MDIDFKQLAINLFPFVVLQLILFLHFFIRKICDDFFEED